MHFTTMRVTLGVVVLLSVNSDSKNQTAVFTKR